MQPIRIRALVAAGAALALSMTACGSQLSRDRLEASNDAFKEVVDTRAADDGSDAAGAATNPALAGIDQAAAGIGTTGATGSDADPSRPSGAAAGGGTGSGSATGSRGTGTGGSTAGGASTGGPAGSTAAVAGKTGAPTPGTPGAPSAPVPG